MDVGLLRGPGVHLGRRARRRPDRKHAHMSAEHEKRRDEALVSVAWLADNLARPGQRIVDMRKGDGYDAAHIPGAVSHGGSPFLRENGDVVSSATFANLMAKLGIDPHTDVIAYDDGNGLFAARLWWVARYYGHTRIKVLDGGWDAWRAEGRETTSVRPTPPAGAFVARPRPELIATTEYVNAALARPDVQLLDVRGDDEWNRTVSNENAVAGHIPGAHHLVWTATVDPASRRFLPGEVLHAAFRAAGIVPGHEVVPYCQGGIRAAHTMLALHLAGLAPSRNYEGSWGAWSKSGMPIELPMAQPAGEAR